MRIAIVDDEGSFARDVKKYIEKYFSSQKKAMEIKCFGASSIFDEIKVRNYYDVYLLDIEMPEISGVELAKKIRDWNIDAKIVFLTAYENYARSGYKVKAYDYILKDSYQEELFLILEQIWKEIKENQEEYYIIPSGNEECKFYINDILYLSKEKQYTIFHCKNEILHRERKAIQNVLKHLPEDRFVGIDKGMAVNLKYVTQFEKFEITLESGKVLNVSRRLRSVVQEKLLDYWGELD